MAFTKVRGRGVTTTDNYTVGVITATKFVGPITGGGGDIQVGVLTATELDLNGSGNISGNLVVEGNLTANGDFTTLNTTLREVELLKVNANSSTTAGIITQTGAGDILNLFDGSTEVFSVADGGNVDVKAGNVTLEEGRLFVKRTTIPSVDVRNSTNTSYSRVILQQGAAEGGYFQISREGTNSTAGAGANSVELNQSSNHPLTIKTNNIERLRITGAGKVGIGTDNPGFLLDVYKTSNDATIRTRTTTAGAWYWADSASTGYYGIRLASSGTEKWFVGSYASHNFQIKDGSSSGGAERFTIVDGTGKIGINTTNPSSKLTIAADSAAAILELKRTNTNTTGSFGAINWTAMDGHSVASIQTRGDGDNEGGHIQFHTTSAASSNDPYDAATPERLRITSAGKVGINTATPAHHLDVVGNIRSYQTTPSLYLQTTANTAESAIIRFGDAGSFQRGSIQYDFSGNNALNFKMGGAGNNVLRLSIEGSTGHITPGAAGTQNLGSTSKEWGHVYLASNKRLYLGSDQSFSAYNDGSGNSVFVAGNNFYLKGNSVYIETNQSEPSAHFNYNGAVKLYFDGGTYSTPKLQTTAIGITVDGEVASSQDYPNFRPALDLNFAAVKKLDSRITYTRTGPASYTDEFGKVVLVGDNVPRFDHDPLTGECKGLLVEESRTNLFAGTAEMANSMGAWLTGGSRGAQGANVKGPDGKMTAYQNVYNGGNGDLNIYYAPRNGASEMTTTNDTTYTMSVWAKLSAGASYITGCRLRTYGQNISVNYDLNNGAVFGTYENQGSDFVSSSIEEYPDGWYRCIMTFKSGTDGNQGFQIYMISGTNNHALNSSGANGESVSFWGAQLEVGSYATSFIPTASAKYAADPNSAWRAPAPRGADIALIDGEEFSDFYNPIESSILVDYTHLNGATVSNMGTNARPYRFRAVGGSDTRIDYVSTSAYHPYVAKDGSAVASLSHGSNPVLDGGVNRSAVRVKENSFAVSCNGSAVSGSALDTSGAWPPDNTITEVSLGGGNGGAGLQLSGHIQRFVYYPVGLPNSQLVTLTS